jgi:hypothetical protein
MTSFQQINNAFQHLDNCQNLSAICGEFSMFTKIYEANLDEKYGIVLENLKNGECTNFKKDFKKNVYFNKEYNHHLGKINNKILKKYESLPGFCSMDICTIDDLFNHMKKIHEISYCHYAWAKENNLGGSFPKYCCKDSSENVFLNLMEKGYPNSSYIYNERYDHAYVALPFLLREMKNKGFIIIDPTSDQLFRTNGPRNNLFVSFGNEWIYETDWKYGKDLFPVPYSNATYANLDSLRNKSPNEIYRYNEIGDYFENVFENPVKIKTPK